ncbi:glycoside hydrolase family 18 protein [Sporobolomyces koalae]|uniref:glycoside hydrolase family 18 protein n=1 Tax=Sporobolomyces koalae TaxID=500713 RepID=UPI003171AF34
MRFASPFPLALLVALVALVSTSSALPTRQSAATFEPLFRPASPHVGPNRSIERLRQRRANVAAEKRSPVVILPTPVAIKNPKAKRASVVERRSAPVVVPNPKTKRSALAAAPAPLSKRSLIASNPKTKRSVVSASISITPARSATPVRRSLAAVSNLLKRFLGDKRGTITVKAVASSRSVVPNPKSPRFPASNPEASSSPESSSIVVSAPTATSTSISTSITSTLIPTSTSTSTSTSTPSSTSVASESTAASTMWPRSGKQIAGGYYPDWEGDNLPPEQINYKMFDLINFSFAIPDEKHNVAFQGWNSGDLLNRVVKYAHGNGSKVLIAIGGWTDSKYFSTAVATSNTRKTFVANIKKMVDKYNVDGVDIDWEYPGTQGNDGNIVSSADTANMLLFLQALRKAMPDKRLSTCTTQQAYIGANGSPLTDVSAFGKVLDNILVMNYDVWGASSTPGPNAPLSDACPNSNQPNANMVSAIQAWTDAGMPASKILMGVPAYGYISSSSATSLIHKRDSVPSTGLSNRHLAKLKRQETYISEGHKWYLTGKAKAEARRLKKRQLERNRKVIDVRAEPVDLAKRDTVIVCPNNHSGKPCEGITDQNITEINWNPLGNATIKVSGPGGAGVFAGSGGIKVGNGDLSGLDGNQINFNDMINYGVIVKKGVNFVGANGYTRKWDDCSSTPFLYNTDRKVVVTYDDPQSLGLKGDMAYHKGIAGLAMWDMSGDTSDFQLTQSWRSAMGLVPLGY